MEVRETQGGITPDLLISLLPNLSNAEEVVDAFDFRPFVTEVSETPPSTKRTQSCRVPSQGSSRFRVVSDTGTYEGDPSQQPSSTGDAGRIHPNPGERYPADLPPDGFSPLGGGSSAPCQGTPSNPGRPHAFSTPVGLGTGEWDLPYSDAPTGQARFDFSAAPRGQQQSEFPRGFNAQPHPVFSGTTQAPPHLDSHRVPTSPPPAAPRQPTIPRSISFDGKGSWQTFYNKFRVFADDFGWTTAQRINQMYWCLEGQAGDYYTVLLNRDKGDDFHDLVRKMGKRFESRDPPEVAQMEFMGARQLPDEGLMDWADRLSHLASRAFPGFPEDSLQQQTVLKFCQGCNDKEAGLYTIHMRPESLESAVDSIKLHQRAARAFAARPRKEVRASTVHTDPEELVMALKGSRPRGRSPSPGLCFKCGKAGHSQKECPEILAGKKVSFISQDDDVEAGNFGGSAEEATLWPEAPAASSWVFQI